MDSYQKTSSSGGGGGSVFKEEAIPFIIYNPETSKFEMTNEAIEFVNNVPSPIGIVAVAGMYRTGKSYLLNRMLLNRSNGFGVGPSINPCTKGLWVWGTPVAGTTADGEAVNVLIVDTEGLGALDEDSNHDVRIFSLAILLSSYFLYNSVGSIDESALSNLSLVINLTKHIHVKSKGGAEDLDTDEYGTYFPSFMWVVRDFTLQLVDQEGEQLNPKEYLEKALDFQKGFSDNVESKNRIRKLLKSFFKDRDCCTMIRPLMNEDNLQNLANLDLSNLRSEFVEQVHILRRKILNRIKVKVMNGKQLTGTMLTSLAQSYVTSINNGAVPNIENAWNYICKSECLKAMDECISKFEEQMKESIVPRIPMEEDELKEFYKTIKKETMEFFQKKAVGGDQTKYIYEIKQKMRHIYDQLEEENERESVQQSQIFLANSYSFIEKKLKNKEFENGFFEYEQDIRAFQQYFMENGPPGPLKRVIMLEFVQQAMAEASAFFNKSTLNELHLQQQIQQEQHKNLEAHIKELKTDFTKEKQNFESKLRSIEVEKAELSAIEQSLRENLERVTQEKKNGEQELSRKLESMTKENKREIEDLKNKIAMTENTSSEMQRKVFATESEFEKDKALLEQKIEFLERTIKDYQKKDEEYCMELKTQKKDHQVMVRDIQTKYEQQIRQINQKLEETTEKFLETQSQFEEIQQKYTYEKQQWQDSQESMKNNANISQTQYLDLQRTIDELKMKSKSEVEKLQYELQDLKENFKFREEDLEGMLRDKEEEIKSLKSRFEKELAIYQQKVEFKEVQVTQLKSQLESTRKAHESMMQAMETKSRESHDGREMAQKQVEELKDIHDKELRKLQKEFDEARKTLEAQIEQLSVRNSELEMEYKLAKQEWEKEFESLKSQMELSEMLRDKAVNQSKYSDSQKVRILEETEERHKMQIYQLEKELEDEKLRAELEIKEVQTKSEESLAQLKNYYEIEKKRLESRLVEEKERDQKKMIVLQEEFDSRLRYEQQQHEEDVEMLQEELREKEMRYQNQLTQLEHENLLYQQKIETLEAHMREKEERYNKEQSMNANQFDQQMDRFNVERREMIQKIENFNSQMSQKDREITLQRAKLDSFFEDLEKKKNQVEELKAEYQQEKQKLNEKIESLRGKNQELSDEFIQKKLEDAREIALYKQSLEFSQKKIDDLQKQNEEQINKYEERIQNQKNDFQQEIQEMNMKTGSMKEQLEQKYEQKRRMFKEQEGMYQKQITEFQKEKAVLEEKSYHLEQKKEEIRIKYESEIAMLKEQIGNNSESLNKEREILFHDNERLKNQLSEMEKEFSEVQSAYERDKALWDGKFQFLEQQKETAKADLQEATRKFEMTLEQLQRRGSAEKDKFELSQNTLIGSIENKFKTQLKEQTENNQRMINELNERNKYLEKENRQLQNRLQLEQRDKMSDHGTMEKKVMELMENENRLQKEIDELKAERDRKVIENQRNLEKEREVYKQRLQENEAKCKELEGKRSTFVFEIEKERAKWGLERDHLVSQKSDVTEQLERLQRRHEILVRENEKLKNERASRKMMYGSGVGQSSMMSTNNGQPPIYQSKFNATSFGQTLMKSINSKENVSTSQAFTSGFGKYIGDGGVSVSVEKVDPHQLPLAVKDNSKLLGAGLGGQSSSSQYLKPGNEYQYKFGTKGLGSVGSSSTDESGNQ